MKKINGFLMVFFLMHLPLKNIKIAEKPLKKQKNDIYH